MNENQWKLWCRFHCIQNKKQSIRANKNVFLMFLSVRNLCSCIWFIHILSYILRSCKMTFMDGCQGACMYPTFPLNKMRPRKSGRYLTDDIFKCIFLNEHFWIQITISLIFSLDGQMINIPSLVPILAWRRPGDKPLSEPIVVSLMAHICITPPQWVNINRSSIKRNLVISYVYWIICCFSALYIIGPPCYRAFIEYSQKIRHS